ncbi:MAG TPA: copper chaperone PCu(A)C [Trebonia sp.]
MIRASFGKSVARSTLIGGLALLAVPAIAGCEAGLNAPTLEFHAAAGGTYTNFNDISISNAFVLGGPAGVSVPTGENASLFVGLYNNGSTDDKLVGVSSSAASHVTIKGGGAAIPASGAADLTGPEPAVVLKSLTQPLSSGENIPVTFDFAHAGAVTLNVPVEPQAFYYQTYSPPPVAVTPTASPSGSAKASTTPKGTPTGNPSATPSASVTPTPTASK